MHLGKTADRTLIPVLKALVLILGFQLKMPQNQSHRAPFPRLLTFALGKTAIITYTKVEEQSGIGLFLVSLVILYFCYYAFTWLQPKLL